MCRRVHTAVRKHGDAPVPHNVVALPCEFSMRLEDGRNHDRGLVLTAERAA